MEEGLRISKEEVISKLKDDGDFDRLRLKIIRKLKDNDELRHKIVSIVKQSAALNSPGAENMKPRQLSDAIYQEVGEVTNHISDGLWEIIRSAEGMKGEIMDTVQSVCDKLLNSNANENDTSKSSMHDAPLIQKGESRAYSSEPKDPLGPIVSHNHQINLGQYSVGAQASVSHDEESSKVLQKKHQANDVSKSDDCELGILPGFSVGSKNGKPRDCSDEDPDVPPGFG